MKNNKSERPSLNSEVLAGLYEAGLALTSNLDLASILEDIGESAKRLLKADISTCYLYNIETNTYALAADIGTIIAPGLNRAPRTDGPTATIVKTKRALISNDAKNDLTPYKESPFTLAEGVQSVAGLPLKDENDEIVGVLHINYRKKNMITPEILRDAGLLANIAGISLSNARRFQYLSSRESSFAELVDIGRKISEAIAKSHKIGQQPVVKLVLDEIASTACGLLNADCATIYPYNSVREEYYELESIGHWGLIEPLELSDKPRSEGGMSSYVKREGIIILDDIKTQDPTMLSNSAFLKRENINAFVGLSVKTDNIYLAVLYISFRSIHRFTQDEIHLVNLFANQASVALQIARLLEKEQNARASLEMKEFLDNFGGNLSHRITGVAGTTPVHVRLIRRELQQIGVNSQKIEQSLSQIENDINRLIEMASKIREMPELQGSPELININELLSTTAQTVVAPPINLVEKLFSEDVWTNLPKTQLKDVFENIIRNATEHMPDGGTVKISMSIRDDGKVDILITDTGSGIDSKKFDKIFELGYSEKKGGIGYGLWWSRTFMRRIGGEINVSSVLGKGSTFKITIPLISSSPSRNNKSDNQT
jgi:signal transduction histidine kinase